MSTIHRLPPSLANQIAAGEVIERPASIVKELIENSIDAHATRITLEVREGGRWLRICDDGTGIAPEDAPLAFERFATSKLSEFEDLYRLETKGFRGEALASISAVARIECLTRLRDAEMGTCIRIDEAGMDIDPCGCPTGTTLQIKDLFYNTPARLKFLKAASTEMAHIHDAVLALALSHPSVGFSLTLEGRESINTIGSANLQEAASLLFNEGNKLVPIEAEGEGIRIWGLASPPNLFRGDRQKQWLFVNGRWVRHATIQKAAEEAYLGHIPNGRYPLLVLNVEIDPARVDVNVHPNKREVRIAQIPALFSLIKKGVYGAIQPAIATSVPAQREDEPFIPLEIPATPAFAPLPSLQRLPDISYSPRENTRTFAPVPTPTPIPPQAESMLRPEPRPETTTSVLPWDRMRVIGQLHRTYILLEHPEGLYLIDQHNSHERILYEQLSPAKIERQELLLPVRLDVTESQNAKIEELKDTLFDLGFIVEESGPKSWTVRCTPALLPYAQIEETLQGFLAEESCPDRERKMRATLACKAATKAGAPLTQYEMENLIKQLSECPQPLTCPHGRPTGSLIPLSEIHRKVLR